MQQDLTDRELESIVAGLGKNKSTTTSTMPSASPRGTWATAPTASTPQTATKTSGTCVGGVCTP